MEKQEIQVRIYRHASQDAKGEYKKYFRYYIDNGYSKSLTGLLWKIYRDVYSSIHQYGSDEDLGGKVTITINPQGYVLPSFLRYCNVIKTWLDYIEFNVKTETVVQAEQVKP